MTEHGGKKVVLVTGATGRQGGAAARRLLERGFGVRSLTRDPGKPKAAVLADLGAEVVRGDLNSPATLEPALGGVWGVFSVQNFWEAGYEGEVRQGKALVDAAKGASVSHFVQSSVGGAHRRMGIAHFESKKEIEEHLRASGLPYTILRPTALMDDWEEEREGLIGGGVLSLPLSPETSLQQVAVEDVGAFAAMAFGRPEEWVGREVDLAGDELTPERMAEVFGRVVGQPVRYERASLEDFRRKFGEELAVMFEWFERAGYEADVAALRREHPGLLTLEGYLRKNGWTDARASDEASPQGTQQHARKEVAR